MTQQTCDRLKRTFDVIVGSVFLFVGFPLFLAITLAIVISAGWPILFRQLRIGRDGRPFTILKFRTMTTAATVESEALANDPRITRVGRALRRTGLDELPQLINVLKGEMSIVGPRPLVASENALCDARQRRRLDVNPGLTGLAQVRGRNRIPWEQRVALDLQYVAQRSAWLDMKIVLQSIPVVLLGRDAYYSPVSAVAP